MKKFKFLPFALFALLATTSCEEKEDEETNDGDVSGAVAVWVAEKMVISQYGYAETYLYSYDSMNRIEKVSEENGYDTTGFEYLDGSIIATEEDEDSRVYRLDNGLVMTYNDMRFSYNSNRELTRCNFEGRTTDYTWTDGLLTKSASSVYDHVDNTITISYADNADITPGCVKFLNAHFLAEFSDADEAVWLNGNFGKVPAKLMSQATEESSYDGEQYFVTSKWAYADITSNGCPQTVTLTINHGGQTDVVTYSITWRKL